MTQKIWIRHPLRPFSRLPGTKLLILHTQWQLTAYPTLLIFSFLGDKAYDPIYLHLTNCKEVESWMVMQDLEKGCISLFNRGKKGHFSYRLAVQEGKLMLRVDRCPSEGVTLFWAGQKKVLQRKEAWHVPVVIAPFESISREKIHFGCHKSQDWELIRRRCQLREIIPLWFALSQQVPDVCGSSDPMPPLLDKLSRLIQEGAQQEIAAVLVQLFRCCFDTMLLPYASDVHHWLGSSQVPEVKPVSLSLLRHSGALLRSLFFRVDCDGRGVILPCLPTDLPAGRLVGLDALPGVTIDLEWSKKRVRRLILTAKETREVSLRFSTQEAAFRIRKKARDRGITRGVDAPLFLEAGERYWLDCFQR